MGLKALWNEVNTSLIILHMNHALTFGSSHHPFRATLPQRVMHRLPEFEPEVRAAMERAAIRAEAPAAAPRRSFLSMRDLRDFLLAYCACFTAVMAFIS